MGKTYIRSKQTGDQLEKVRIESNINRMLSAPSRLNNFGADFVNWIQDIVDQLEADEN